VAPLPGCGLTGGRESGGVASLNHRLHDAKPSASWGHGLWTSGGSRTLGARPSPAAWSMESPCCRPRALTRRQACRTSVRRVRASGHRRSPWNVRTGNARCGIPCLGLVDSGFRVFRGSQTPGCGPAVCGAEVVACCLGEVEGSHARCLSAAKGWNHETHEIHEKGNLLVPADRVRGPESSRAVPGARFP
jgi:hypothetical protein